MYTLKDLKSKKIAVNTPTAAALELFEEALDKRGLLSPLDMPVFRMGFVNYGPSLCIELYSFNNHRPVIRKKESAFSQGFLIIQLEELNFYPNKKKGSVCTH